MTETTFDPQDKAEAFMREYFALIERHGAFVDHHAGTGVPMIQFTSKKDLALYERMFEKLVLIDIDAGHEHYGP